MEVIDVFRAALAEKGLTPPEIIADGEPHGFQMEGDARPNSWYVVDGAARAGAFGCFKRGVLVHWSESGQIDNGATKARIEAAIERHRVEYRTMVAERAQELWFAAHQVEAHPYLSNNGVAAHGIRVDERGLLVVPVNNAEGALCGLRYVYADGFVADLVGTEFSERLFMIGVPNGEITVCRDYVTAAKHFEVTGLAAAVAFEVENVPIVARVLAEKYPEARIAVHGAEGAAAPMIASADAVAEIPVAPAAALSPAAVVDHGVVDGVRSKRSARKPRPQPADTARGTRAAKVDTWMPFYIGDYLADTTRLTTEQHGAYVLMIFDYWRNDPPPDDDAILASIVRSTPDVWRSRLRPALVGFFQVVGGYWHHKRIDIELVKAIGKRQKAKANASHAASKRWGHRPDDDASRIAQGNAPSTTPKLQEGPPGGPMPGAMLEQCPSPSPSPREETTTPFEQSPARRRKRERLNDVRFDRFYKAYPRKESRAVAERAWAALAPDDLLAERICKAVPEHASSEQWRKDGGKFIPHPATWLNGRRWEDEIGAHGRTAGGELRLAI
jgi:uncharacterized protein YdaU (DUF1376 family)